VKSDRSVVTELIQTATPVGSSCQSRLCSSARRYSRIAYSNFLDITPEPRRARFRALRLRSAPGIDKFCSERCFAAGDEWHVTSVWIGARMYRRRSSNIPPCTVRNKMLSFCLSTGFSRKLLLS
jgi:hypothetical protein